MGDWFKGGRRLAESPCEKIMTRGELQRKLKARIEQGDQNALRISGCFSEGDTPGKITNSTEWR